jgi:hypothetical protein
VDGRRIGFWRRFWIYSSTAKGLVLTVNSGHRLDIYLGTVKATVGQWALLQPVK